MNPEPFFHLCIDFIHLIKVNSEYPEIDSFVKAVLEENLRDITRHVRGNRELLCLGLLMCTDFGLGNAFDSLILSAKSMNLDALGYFTKNMDILRGCLCYEVFDVDSLGFEFNAEDNSGYIHILSELVGSYGLVMTPFEILRFFSKIDDTGYDMEALSGFPVFPLSNEELRGMFNTFSTDGNICGRVYILTRYSVKLSFLDNTDWNSALRRFVVPWDTHSRMMIMMYDKAGSRDIMALYLARGYTEWVGDSFRTYMTFSPRLNMYDSEIANRLFFKDKDGYYMFVFYNRARRSLGLINVPDELLRLILLTLY